ncbi:MAG: hypothetical protein FJZ58_04340 [Chlamydiae bacterium]|nr:hypothetical protein [Chlamydiota bacterium]
MKWLIYTWLIVGSSFLFSEITTPKWGEAVITPQEGLFESTIEGGKITLSLPRNWGIGQVVRHNPEKTWISLFPRSGGYGCEILVQHIDDKLVLEEEKVHKRSFYSQVHDLVGGFEAHVHGSWYACWSHGAFLVQVWYSLPKYTQANAEQWASIRQCLVLEDPSENYQHTYSYVERQYWTSWCIGHPDYARQVMLDVNMGCYCLQNDPLSYKSVLQIIDRDHEGFFYVKWDQEDLDVRQPFDTYTREIMEEIHALQEGQFFDQERAFYLSSGVMFLPGVPYSIVVMSGEDFLVGFAMKKRWDPWDQEVWPIWEYLRRVRWKQGGDYERVR